MQDNRGVWLNQTDASLATGVGLNIFSKRERNKYRVSRRRQEKEIFYSTVSNEI